MIAVALKRGSVFGSVPCMCLECEILLLYMLLSEHVVFTQNAVVHFLFSCKNGRFLGGSTRRLFSVHGDCLCTNHSGTCTSTTTNIDHRIHDPELHAVCQEEEKHLVNTLCSRN